MHDPIHSSQQNALLTKQAPETVLSLASVIANNIASEQQHQMKRMMKNMMAMKEPYASEASSVKTLVFVTPTCKLQEDLLRIACRINNCQTGSAEQGFRVWPAEEVCRTMFTEQASGK